MNYSVMIRAAHSTSDTNVAGLPNFAPHRVSAFGVCSLLGKAGAFAPLQFRLPQVRKAQGYSTPLIVQMSPPCGRKRSNITHSPSGDQTG